MFTIAVANQKGGVGKTTSVITIAGLLAEKSQKILVIDLDPHGSLSHYLSLYDNSKQSSCYDLFVDPALSREQILQLRCPTQFPNIDLMPANLALSALENQPDTKGGLGLKLKRALQKIESDYDFVLLDSPPMIGVLMINALAACDLLVVPVQTEHLAFYGLEQMVNTIQMIERSTKQSMAYLIVPTMFEPYSLASQSMLRKLHHHFGEKVWGSEIPPDTKLREASQQGVPPSFYAPLSKGVLAYRRLIRAILQSLVALSKQKQAAAANKETIAHE